MADEQVFTVTDSRAVRSKRVTMAQAGLLERQLQDWIKEYPDMLGEDVLVITEEFDRWATATGRATWERLDILGLDRTGRLVVAELKRYRAPDAVLVQALNYAAMASRFSLDLLAEAYAHFHPSNATPEAVLGELRAWAPSLSDESLAPPRIVLVAEDFGPVLTNTTMFLIESGVDVRLIRIGIYQLDGGELAMTASQVLPVPQAEEFMIRPRSSAPTQRAARDAATRRASVTDRLIAAETFPPGQQLSIVVPTVNEDLEAIEHWLALDAARPRVRWRHDARKPIEWLVDGSNWTMRELIREIIVKATEQQPRTGIWGPNWFLAPDGRTLARIAEELPDLE